MLCFSRFDEITSFKPYKTEAVFINLKHIICYSYKTSSFEEGEIMYCLVTFANGKEVKLDSKGDFDLYHAIKDMNDYQEITFKTNIGVL